MFDFIIELWMLRFKIIVPKFLAAQFNVKLNDKFESSYKKRLNED